MADSRQSQVSMGHFIDASTITADIVSIRALQDAITGVSIVAKTVGETMKNALKLPDSLGKLDKYFDTKKIEDANKAVKKFNDTLKDTKKAAAEAGKEITGALDVTEKAGKAERSVKGVGTSVEELKKKLKEARNDLKEAFKVDDVVGGLIDFGKEAYKTSVEHEKLMTTLKSADPQNEAENIKSLKEQIEQLHLSGKDATEVFSKMANQFSDTNIKGSNLRAVFEGISTAAAAKDLSTEQYKELAAGMESIGKSATVSKGQLDTLDGILPGTMKMAQDAMHENDKQFKDSLNNNTIKGEQMAVLLGAKMKAAFAGHTAGLGDSVDAQMTDLKNIFEDFQVTLAQAAGPALDLLASGLASVASVAKDVVDWMDKNKSLVGDLVIIIGTAVGAYQAYNLAMKISSIWQGITGALTAEEATASEIAAGAKMTQAESTDVLTASQEGLNVAMEANPLGIIITIIGAVVAAVAIAATHFDKFKAVLVGVWEVAKDVGQILFGVGEILIGINPLMFNPWLIKDGYKRVTAGFADIGGAFSRGYDGNIKKSEQEAAVDAARKKKADEELKEKQAQYGVTTGANTTTKVTGRKNEPVNNAKATPVSRGAGGESMKAGNKGPTTISIRIDSLIKDFKVETVNMRDGALQVKDIVTRVLLAAVNDAQIVRGQ